MVADRPSGADKNEKGGTSTGTTTVVRKKNPPKEGSLGRYHGAEPAVDKIYLGSDLKQKLNLDQSSEEIISVMLLFKITDKSAKPNTFETEFYKYLEGQTSTDNFSIARETKIELFRSHMVVISGPIQLMTGLINNPFPNLSEAYLYP